MKQCSATTVPTFNGHDISENFSRRITVNAIKVLSLSAFIPRLPFNLVYVAKRIYTKRLLNIKVAKRARLLNQDHQKVVFGLSGQLLGNSCPLG